MGDECLVERNQMSCSMMEENKRICIVGSLGQDPNVLQAAETFQVPIISCETVQEHLQDNAYITYYVLNEFEGEQFDLLFQLKCRILGPTALKELAQNGEPLPPSDRLRPIYSLSMRGLIICFTGFKVRDELCHLASLIHQMGGSIRKDMDCKITHLVANAPNGAKYQYASTFNIPIMAESWVTMAWENRHIIGYSSRNTEVIAEHKLKLGGTRVCFIGFSSEETEHMSQVLISNRGTPSTLEDPECSHLVLDSYETYELIRMNIIKPANSPCNIKCPRSASKGEGSSECLSAIDKLEEIGDNRGNNRSSCDRIDVCNSMMENEKEEDVIMSENFDDKKNFDISKGLLNVVSESNQRVDSIEEEEDEELHCTRSDKKNCKMVVDELNTVHLPDNTPSKAYIVKAEWFWASVQNELCADEKEYLFELPLDSTFSPDKKRYQSTPMSANARTRKRKRLQQKASSSHFESPLTNKRRSSISDAGLLSLSGSYLDCTVTPEKETFDEVEVDNHHSKHASGRRQVFLELVQTESNYVNILNTILSLFKNPLEEMLESENMILNTTEVKIIFGNLPPIYDIHSNMLEELKWGIHNWKEDFGIGSLILKYAPELEKAYPPFINYFEKSKETLEHCDLTKPRFHAFLKIRQTKPECGRQTLKELLIRPVQRLPSISLLLNDLLKQTDKQNPDQMYLEQALAGVKQAMAHINEDKRKTEAQLAMFDLFNEIDNCPAHLISSHRSLVAKCECVEITEVLSSKKGDTLVFLLFTDTLEVCKKRARTFNTFRNTKPSSLQKMNKFRKQYKHIRLMPLSNLRKVIDIRESEECQNVFALLCRNSQSLKESLCSFTITDEKVDKSNFLKQMCKQMAHTVCTPDPEDFYDIMDSAEISIDTASNTSLKSTHSLSKAFRFASKTGVKVGRALSMSKTPNKFTRAISAKRPFSAQGTLTPNANQLAQMRLQSCANLKDLNFTPTRESPVPPMSVQPTRRNMLASAFSVSSLKLL